MKQGKNYWKKLSAVLLVCALGITSMSAVSGIENVKAAETMAEVHIEVQYGQTEARTMLKMVNDFRQGPDAWAWNEDNTEKIAYTGLDPLSYDYTLEKIAMKRALEVALVYSHTRPNGEKYITAYEPYYYDYRVKAENVSYGTAYASDKYSHAEAVFEDNWLETDKDYSGQGHRRNMLTDQCTAIGIGHVYYNNCHYWVQEFGNPALNTEQDPANDGSSVDSVGVKADSIEEITANIKDITIKENETRALENVEIMAKITGHAPVADLCVIKNEYILSSEDESVLKIQDGNLYGVSTGSTFLKLTVLDKEVMIPVIVTDNAASPTSTPTIATIPPQTMAPTQTAASTATPPVQQDPVQPMPTQGSQPGSTVLPVQSSQPKVTESPAQTENPFWTPSPDRTENPVPDDALTSIEIFDYVINDDSSDNSSEKIVVKKVTSVKCTQKKKTAKAVVKFAKQKNVSGYELLYATNKKFTKQCKQKVLKKNTVTLKLKRGKTYYIKVRAYQIDSAGNKHYGEYSKAVKRKMK